MDYLVEQASNSTSKWRLTKPLTLKGRWANKGTTRTASARGVNEARDNMANTSKNILNGDVEIRGSLKCGGELAFDGKIEGDLTTEGNLDLGENTVVRGNISALAAVVRGKINGNVATKDRLEIKSRTELVGDIKASKLVIEEGVAFSGRAEINPGKSATAPAAQPAPSGRGEPYKGPLLGGHARA